MLRHSRSLGYLLSGVDRMNRQSICHSWPVERAGHPADVLGDAWHDLTNGCFTSGQKMKRAWRVDFRSRRVCILPREDSLSLSLSCRDEHLAERGEKGGKSGETDVETSRWIGSARRNRDEGNELKREESRWGPMTGGKKDVLEGQAREETLLRSRGTRAKRCYLSVLASRQWQP